MQGGEKPAIGVFDLAQVEENYGNVWVDIVIKEFTTTRANLYTDVISNLEVGYIKAKIA